VEVGRWLRAFQVNPEALVPPLDTVGGKGMLPIVTFYGQVRAAQSVRAVEPHRRFPAVLG